MYFRLLVCSPNPGHLPYKLHLVNCGDYTSPVHFFDKSKTKRKTSGDLLDSKALSWRAGGSLFFVLITVKKVTTAGYRCTSYPDGLALRTELANLPCLGCFHFGAIRDSVRSVSTLGGPRFHARYAEHGFSNSVLFSLPGSMAVFILSEPYLRPILRLCLRAKVADGSPKSSVAGLADKRLSKQRGLVKVFGRELLSYLFHTVTISC